MKNKCFVLLVLSVGFFSIPTISSATENLDSSVATSESTDYLVSDTSNSIEISSTGTTPTTSSTSNNVKKITVDNNDSSEPETDFSEIQQYFSLNKTDQAIYDKSGEQIIASSNDLLNQTVLAKKVITHHTGKLLYQIFNEDNKELGYIFEDAATETETSSGVYHSFDKYATITEANSQTWQNFDWTPKFSGDVLANKTFFAKGKYHHFNGNIYLSLFDNKGIWYGYINQNSVKITDNSQGSYNDYNKYITFSNKNYNTWSNFGWKFRQNGNEIVNKTMIAKGIYYHHNGNVYFSLYDTNNKWYGYVNKNATTLTDGPQGKYNSFGKYVTFKNPNYNTWSNFDWKYREEGKILATKTFLAKGVYHHVNGNDYVSLYDNQNKWHGYVNIAAVDISDGRQGIYQNYNKYVSISNQNYSIWQNFNWKKKNSTKNIYEKTYLAKGIYKHFNGDTYLSIYDSKGTWFGYLNISATKETERSGIAIRQNKYISVISKNYDTWNNFNFSSTRGKTTNMINKPYLVKYKYEHFNGSTYYSLYDKNNKWQGYLNRTGVKEANGSNSTYVMLNAPFYNQMEEKNGRKAYMGCEAASLLQALHLKGYAKNYTLHPFIDVMPRSKNNNPNNGFSGDPYGNIFGVYHSIFPKPLTKWANQYSKGNAHDISGSSLTQLSKELTNGNPIVLYVTLNFEQKSEYYRYAWGIGLENAHVVTLDGYNSQTNQYHISDPNKLGGYWINEKSLQYSYFANEKRAVVIR
ncbi:MAG: C39 family peptidase [Vagococcus sp.]|uniref:C39 family peptidase n=1 Tax=Vagococcus sp. TaxID=1933889 RepID=UPI002FC7F35A